jgi:hypothetical protein
MRRSIDERDMILCARYPLPASLSPALQKSVLDKELTRANYTRKMHALLYLEERAQLTALSRSVQLLISRFFLFLSIQISHFNMDLGLCVNNFSQMCQML